MVPLGHQWLKTPQMRERIYEKSSYWLQSDYIETMQQQTDNRTTLCTRKNVTNNTLDEIGLSRFTLVKENVAYCCFALFFNARARMLV